MGSPTTDLSKDLPRIVAILLLLAIVGACAERAPEPQVVHVGSTTSLYDSGLLDTVSPRRALASW